MMKGAVKLKALLFGFLFFLFALVAYRNSEGAAYAYEVCILKTYTIECSDGTNNFSTTQYYWDCVTYFGYLYEGGGDGGSGGGGGSNGGDLDDPGSGGGGIINPDFDTNDDNVLDCYKMLMFLGSNSLVITSGFQTAERPDHNGLDIGSVPDRNACYGQPVYSVCNGIVTDIYFSTDGGWTVILVDDNGRRWGICHLMDDPSRDSSINLSINKRVYAGITAIGRADSTGNCDGPHIHLSLKENGEYKDPYPYLSGC